MGWLSPRNTPRFSGNPTGGTPLPIVVLTAMLVLACERTPPASARKDTVVSVAPPPETTVVPVVEASKWDSTAGPALFVLGPTVQEALVIMSRYTDTTAIDSLRLDVGTLRSKPIDLFAAGSRIGRARIGAITVTTRSDSCRTWPIARLEPRLTDTTVYEAAVGFEAEHAAEWPVDSIAALPQADSARLVADIARIASALPGDTAAAFRGLPFVVTNAWRTKAGGGPQVIAAIVIRNVNQEANPRQERILLLAERDTLTTTARYIPRYSERVTGLEETVETTDVIAMVLLGADRRPTVVVARDAGNGTSYALIERIAGVWQRRWASAYAGC
jgi:hypothetical protein